jgi:hypothetical protein
MIDLQIHTNATPGHATWDPEALTEAAVAAGLTVIAVTDHNTLDGVAATQAAGAQRGLRVISGVEFDTGFPAGGRAGAPLKLWHTLVYGAPPQDPGLTALCRAVFERNAQDAQALRVLFVSQGMRLRGLDDRGRPANVAEVAAALARDNTLPGRVPGEDDEAAGMRYVLTHIPGSYNPVSVAEVIAAAHAAGALAVLAHPGREKGIYAIPADEADIAALAGAGLDGIEVFYPSHSAAQRATYRELARRHGLLISAGSDSHGPHQPFVPVAPAALRIAPGTPTIIELCS